VDGSITNPSLITMSYTMHTPSLANIATKMSNRYDNYSINPVFAHLWNFPHF